MTNTTAILPYVGWLRQRGRRWEPVIRATTEAAAWNGLLSAPRSGSHCDLCVMQTGEHPAGSAGERTKRSGP